MPGPAFVLAGLGSGPGLGLGLARGWGWGFGSGSSAGSGAGCGAGCGADGLSPVHNCGDRGRRAACRPASRSFEAGSPQLCMRAGGRGAGCPGQRWPKHAVKHTAVAQTSGDAVCERQGGVFRQRSRSRGRGGLARAWARACPPGLAHERQRAHTPGFVECVPSSHQAGATACATNRAAETVRLRDTANTVTANDSTANTTSPATPAPTPPALVSAPTIAW